MLLKMPLSPSFEHLPDTLKSTLEQKVLPKVVPQISGLFSKAGVMLSSYFTE